MATEKPKFPLDCPQSIYRFSAHISEGWVEATLQERNSPDFNCITMGGPDRSLLHSKQSAPLTIDRGARGDRMVHRRNPGLCLEFLARLEGCQIHGKTVSKARCPEGKSAIVSLLSGGYRLGSWPNPTLL